MTAKCLLDAKTALETLDLEMVASIYAPEALFEDVPAGLKITDKAKLREYFTGLFNLPGVAFSDIRIFDGGDFGVIEWTWSGVNRKTVSPFHVRGVSMVELRDGRFARESIYYDPAPAS
jgi:ketosteroid isomerase-like protein